MRLSRTGIAALEAQAGVEVELHRAHGHVGTHGPLDAGDALVAEAGAQLHSGDASGGQLLRGSLRLSVGLAAHHVQMDARGGYHGAGGLIGIADKKEKCGLQCHCYVDLPENQESERTDKRCRFPCGSLICTPVIWYVTVW